MVRHFQQLGIAFTECGRRCLECLNNVRDFAVLSRVELDAQVALGELLDGLLKV